MRFILLTITTVIVAFQGIMAQTEVPRGNIDGETWKPAGSPYIVTGDLKIIFLIIEPGVIVQFDENHKFDVEGILQAKGFFSDSIYFQPDSENNVGWEGIKFKSGAVSSSLKYCRIEGSSKEGINIDQAQPEISNCRIIDNDENGIFLESTIIQLQHCIISNNTLNGVETEAAQLTILNSIISGNWESGILSTHNDDRIVMTNVVIADNQDKGIDCPNGNLKIRNSIIYDNDNAIQIDSQDDNTQVTYSDIQGEPVNPDSGIINDEPEFFDRNNYTLLPQSPCINAGNPNPDDEDRYFPPSMGTSRNDMGAYGGPQAFGWYPPLYIKPQHLDFNRVTQDSSQSTVLNILNYRDTLIAVSDILFEDDDSNVFSREPDDFIVAVLDSIELTVTFEPDSEKVYTSDLILQTQSHGTVSLPVTGEGVLPHIEIFQSELDFFLVPLGKNSYLNLPIQNSGGDTLQIELLHASNLVFQIEQTILKINPGPSSDSIRITFTPDSVKTYQDSLIILSNDRDIPRIAIPLSGEGFGPVINIDPIGLNFGSVAVLSDTLLYLTISNLGNNSLDIDSLTLTQPDSMDETFSISDIPAKFPIELDPDSSLMISVRFTPAVWGQLPGRLLVYSTDPFRDMITVVLLGKGIAPEIIISSTELDFGEVLIISDSTQILTIENIGNLQLIIEDFEISPSDSVFELSDTTISFPFDIKPGNSAKFPIEFKPVDTGLVDGQILISSNDPYRSEIFVLLSGRGNDTGLLPEIELSAYALEFNEVDTSTFSQKTLHIYNKGYVDLIIPEDSIYITDSEHDAFSILNITEDIRINPQDSLDIVIRFEPMEFGPDQANLWIRSNDPLNPALNVTLSGTGTGDGWVPKIIVSTDVLEFNQVDTSSFSQKSFYISNKGYLDLIIPQDSIYITYSAYDAFSILDIKDDIMIVPQDSQEIVIRFEPAELGPDQANLWIKSNDPLNPTMFVLLSGIGIGNGSATISFDPANSTNPLISRQTATFSFEITSFVPTDSATVFARKGGETTFTAFSLQNQGTTSVWSTEIDSNLITERGVEYYVQVNQSHTFSLYPQEGESQPIAVSVQIPYLAFPEKIPGKTYQMISIPFSTPDQNLSDLFLDNLGSYNNINYRIFECTNGSDYSEIREMNKPLPPGKSIWLISREPVELDIYNGESVLTDHEYTIELQQGWNMISTPFAFPVSWVDLGASLALRHYDGSDWPFATIMDPFRGYAVNVPQDTVISIPANEAVFVKSLPKPAHPEFADNWLIQISAESGDIKDQFNYVGTLNSATSGIDRFDHPEPLPIGDYISLYLVSPENDGHFSTDYREPDAEGYSFEIELRSNISGHKYIQMIPKNLPKSYDWLVIASTTKVNLGKKPIRTSLNQVSYKLIVGTSDYIDENLEDYKTVPKVFKLAQNYPNPFNPSTKITYQLPISSEVDLSIYNLLGQKVITLVSDKQEAGYYRIEWKGLNQSNQLVSSGIYFLQLKTKHFIQTIKMILQR